MGVVEKSFGKTVRGVFYTLNPIKKKIIKTYCIVHKFINMQAIDVLYNEGLKEEAAFYKKYIKALNEGVTWADQDFKSSNHFYHVNKERGLFGFSNLLLELKKYYGRATSYYKEGDIYRSMFFLGVCCHMIQDATVPQHTDNKLLKDHRKFEQWIISKLLLDFSFTAKEGMIQYDNLEDYVKNNAAFARATINKYGALPDLEEKYYKVSVDIIKEAEKTTSGLLKRFYMENI